MIPAWTWELPERAGSKAYVNHRVQGVWVEQGKGKSTEAQAVEWRTSLTLLSSSKHPPASLNAYSGLTVGIRALGPRFGYEHVQTSEDLDLVAGVPHRSTQSRAFVNES